MIWETSFAHKHYVPKDFFLYIYWCKTPNFFGEHFSKRLWITKWSFNESSEQLLRDTESDNHYLVLPVDYRAHWK